MDPFMKWVYLSRRTPSIDFANDLIYQVIHYSETFFSCKPKKYVSSIYAITLFIEQFIILKPLLPGKKYPIHPNE